MAIKSTSFHQWSINLLDNEKISIAHPEHGGALITPMQSKPLYCLVKEILDTPLESDNAQLRRIIGHLTEKLDHATAATGTSGNT